MGFANESRYSIERVVELLQLPTQGGGKRLTCPVCALEGPGVGKNSIGIAPNGRTFKCFRCEAHGSGVHLYGLFKYGYGYDYIENNDGVKRSLYGEMLGKDPSGLAFNQNAFSKKEIQKVDVRPASLAERNNTYSKLLTMLDLTDEHKADLRRRGLRDSDIIANGYKSVPRMGYTKIPRDLRNEACDLLGVPGFYKKGETWALKKNNKGFFIPARDVSLAPNNRFGQIQGMQIRFDTVTSDDVRYKWLSTRDMVSGCAAETYAHFVGTPRYSILLTEGPLKADIIYRFTEMPIVAVPGVNSVSKLALMLPKLWKAGVRKIVTAFDMDYITNVNVQESYIKLVRLLQEHGFIVERLLWDENYKGLDDFLLNVYKQKGGQMSDDINPEGLLEFKHPV